MADEAKPIVEVGLLGHGHLGKFHAQKARHLRNSKLTVIVEPEATIRQRLKTEYPDVEICQELSQALPLAQAFLIVTPTSMHFPMTVECLKAQKHVFIEKPMVANLMEAKLLKDLLQKYPVKLQVGHSERFHAAWEIIKREQYQAFFQGNVSVRINRLAPFKGRAVDVDVITDLMIHDIDIVRLLFAKNPSRITAFGHKMRTANWDHVTTSMSYTEDLNVIMTAGRNYPREERSVEIISDYGTILVDLFACQIFIYSGVSETPEIISYEKRDHLLLEQELFYNAILKNQEVPVNFDDGIYALKVMDAISRSLENKEVVDLAW